MTANEFEEEACRIRGMLENTAKGILGNSYDAQDSVQEAMLKLWTMHEELRCPMAKLAQVITRNICIDRIRRRHVTVDAENAGLHDKPESDDTQEQIDIMMKILETLPAMQQIIMRLRHLEGMTISEISQMTGSSEPAVRQALCRARQAVRIKMDAATATRRKR